MMITRYRLYNSAGCETGEMTQEELCAFIERGMMEDGDTIRVSIDEDGSTL